MFSFIDFLKTAYYEYKSQFVPKQVNYKLEGECIKCGQCCKYMYSVDTYTEKEFNLMTKFFPKYKRFKIIGRDNYNNLIFSCNLLDENNLCSDYKNRLKMCKKYPGARVNGGGKLHESCGYKLIPIKTFEEYFK